MTWLIVETLILLAIAFLIGAIIGYFLRLVFSDKSRENVSIEPQEGLKAQSGNKTAVKPEDAGSGEETASLVAVDEENADDPKANFAAVMAKEAVEITIKDDMKEAAEKADKVGKRPRVLAAAVGGMADNLKRVKGIGPKNEKNLNSIGIFHFSQVAAWSEEEANWIGSFMAFPGRIERENWISQADVLAKGGDTAFSKRVDKGEVESSQ